MEVRKENKKIKICTVISFLLDTLGIACTIGSVVMIFIYPLGIVFLSATATALFIGSIIVVNVITNIKNLQTVERSRAILTASIGGIFVNVGLFIYFIVKAVNGFGDDSE